MSVRSCNGQFISGLGKPYCLKLLLAHCCIKFPLKIAESENNWMSNWRKFNTHASDKKRSSVLNILRVRVWPASRLVRLKKKVFASLSIEFVCERYVKMRLHVFASFVLLLVLSLAVYDTECQSLIGGQLPSLPITNGMLPFV